MEHPGQDQIKKIQQANRTAYLIAGFIRETLTTEEKEELDDWITASEENMRLFGELTDPKNIAASLEAYEKIDTETALKKLRSRTGKKKRISFWRYAVAIIAVLAIGLTIFLMRTGGGQKGERPIVHRNDITPGTGKAKLTLGDGSEIILEGKDTTIQSTINVSASMYQISYLGPEQSPDQYHTLSTPRKGYYSLILNDGTKVWLNAESSIRFPVSFSDTQRLVYVTGESFFEVAKDPGRPFRVVADEMLVQAIGTQFNVNVYADEPVKTTTLIEGKVRVFVPGDSLILVPNEQSLVVKGTIAKTSVEVTTAIAWKENKFRFRNTEIAVIMRQLARWYGAEIEYKEAVDVRLNATIDRDEPVSKILELLEGTGEVKFEIKDNKISVSK